MKSRDRSADRALEIATVPKTATFPRRILPSRVEGRAYRLRGAIPRLLDLRGEQTWVIIDFEEIDNFTSYDFEELTICFTCDFEDMPLIFNQLF